MFVAQQPSTFLDFFIETKCCSFSHFFLVSYFITEKNIMAHCMILVVYRAYDYEVYVAPLLRRRVFTGLIDSSCFFLALSSFWLSISFLQILCHNTELVIMSCITSYVLSQPTTTRNTTTITNYT